MIKKKKKKKILLKKKKKNNKKNNKFIEIKKKIIIVMNKYKDAKKKASYAKKNVSNYSILNCEKYYQRTLTIPLYPELKKKSIDLIIYHLNNIFKF